MIRRRSAEFTGQTGTVLCSFSGGLGNQLFRYAATRAISFRTGRRWIGDVSAFRYDTAYRRRWMLGSFVGPRRLPLQDPSTWFGCALNRLACRYRLWCRPDWQLVLEQKPARYSDCLLRLGAPNVIVSGDWQSERYFTDCRTQLLTELSFADPVPESHADLASQIEESEEPVAIAFRSYSDVAALERTQLPISYYTTALDMIRQRVPRARVFAFSDGPLAPEAQRLIGSRTTVSINPPVGADRTGMGQFMAMIRCKHFVIANSSFSWWAAWLSQHHWPTSAQAEPTTRTIIAPAHCLFNADFVPEWWTTLESHR